MYTNRKRKLSVLCAAVITAVMFGSCGTKNDDSSSKKADVSAAETVTLPTITEAPEEVPNLDTTGESDITPAIWTVKGDNGVEVTLTGSMHALKDSDYPMPKEMLEAYNESDILAVEADLTESGSITFQSAMLAAMYYDDTDDKLSNHISQKGYEVLEKYLDLYSMDISSYTHMRPWAVYTVVENLSLAKSDLSGDMGLDKYLLIKAHSDNKEIYEVEGLEFQFDLFADLSDDVYSMLFESRENSTVEDDLKALEELHEAWATGDLGYIETASNEEIETDDKNAAAIEEYENKIYKNRNKIMTEAVENFLKGDKNVLFVVGAAHYVGDEGIISQLEKDGYTVERVEYKPD
ncbi:TraB/GumN family protein [Ruminococcus albus]|uniref:GumN family protein n=1 Tax=Ruminococcus albus TaxID=1264 RepID=A0A1I1DUA8_RUMAL|nr:TraB/GumN family protein [Ruminococcus albus]SFB76290.1 hypothetical protein SAMN02910406_00437 [Ruminococcus albus]